ncbi:alpha-1A adrenergic receptor [Triplophysa rosa]|uniref:Alpha-1B adrenergic receptor n=1 Tax=Triplophysa rosa TaxID=992332 RepID=A0A9W7TD44_TRIRA|nr:alpha-1A adrenergic receptor [Triplophysa rosa]KAI7796348.1 putative alpha-1B adrenergic receptor [Triplophysa rosa]
MNSDTDHALNFLSNGSSELNEPLSASNVSNSTTAKNGTESSSFSLRRAVPLGMVLGAFIVFAIVGNILVILSVVCNRHLRIPTNYFIINLAMADLLLATTVLPVSATLEILNYWVFGRIFCDIWAALDVLCCTASIMSLCVISIDRYIGVRYPLQYPSIVTEKRALLAMLGVWVLAIVISIGPLLGWKQPPSKDETVCPITEEPFYALFSSLGSFYIPLAVILAMYCRVYIVAKRTTKNLEAGMMKERMDSNELTLRIHYKGSQTQDDCSAAGSKGLMRSSLTLKLLKFSREKKAAKTLGVVVGMFILCWLPFFLALPIGSFNESLRLPDTFFKVIFWLGYFNSCLNPIIYPCYSREFKQAFIRILRCQCQQRKQQGWKAYNYRVQTGSANQGYTDTSSICMNGSQQTLAPVQPSPCFSRGGGSRQASAHLPGWGPGNSSPSLSGSPFPGKKRPGEITPNSCKPSRMTLMFPNRPFSKGHQHANGQNAKGEEHLRPTTETTM